ncbi:MAG: nuclear transport factor 2 family protein [Bacteroidota bacterium]
MDKKIFSILLSSCLLCSCGEDSIKEKERSTDVGAEITSRVQEFHTADTTLNAQGVISLLWPEYTMMADGKLVTYEQVKTGAPDFMESLETFYTEWHNLKVIPLGNDHAISTFTFHDSIVTKDGLITLSTGPNTFIWEKRDTVWKVIFADADHYPVTRDSTASMHHQNKRNTPFPEKH